MRRSDRVAASGAQRTRQPGEVEVLLSRQGPGDTAVGPDEQRVDVHPFRIGGDGVVPCGSTRPDPPVERLTPGQASDTRELQ